MKPFDLDAAARGEPIITRNGQKLIFIGWDPRNPNEGRRLILRVDGNPMAIFAYENGRSNDSALDAFMAPKKRTVWLNVYPDGKAFHYETESAAGYKADNDKRLGGKAWPLEIEE